MGDVEGLKRSGKFHKNTKSFQKPVKVDTHPLRSLARAAEVDDLDLAPAWVDKENVLGLEVAVDDGKLLGGKKLQGGAELVGEFAGEVERDALEIGVANEVVQIVRQQLKHQTQVTQLLWRVTRAHEVPEHVHCGGGDGGVVMS